MLSKERGRPIYLLSKNLQIRLWHQQLGHLSNAKVIEAFKLTDKIDIMIEESEQIQEKPFSSNFEINNKDKNSEQSSANNTSPIPKTTLFNKAISTGINPNHFVK